MTKNTLIKKVGVFYHLIYGILLASVLTLLDALAHFYQSHFASPGLFIQQLAATMLLYTALALFLWSIVWVLLIKMGGMRPRVAFVFIAVYLSLHVLAVLYLELFEQAFLLDLNEFRPLLAAGLALPALVMAAVATLIGAKLSRHDEEQESYPIPIWQKLSAICMLLLLAIALPWSLELPDSRNTPAAFTPQDHPIKHVILITVDTLRHDAVTSLNPSGGLTKNMDRLAADGATFSNAFSTAPWTLPSIASLMTGLSPAHHRAISYASVLPTKVNTLAEQFSDAGYRTAGIGDNIFLTPRCNMDQGFHEYHWTPVPLIRAKTFDVGLAHWVWAMPLNLTTSTPKLTDNAINWIKANKDDNFFFWLHYYDPHMPYTPPEEFLSDEVRNSEHPKQFMDMLRVRTGLRSMKQEERDWIKGLYDGEVRYVDHHLGRLFDQLQEMGIYDDALIVLTSDHGEEFWDHGAWEHGHSLYNELINVPLFIKQPGKQKPVTVDSYVSTQSLPLTLLELCGVAPKNIFGEVALAPMAASLTGLLNNSAQSPPTENIYSGYLLYYHDLESVITDSQKLIHDKNNDSTQYFDLNADPTESQPAENVQNDFVKNALDALEFERKSAEAIGISDSDAKPLSEQDIQTLKAVGYL